MKKILFVGESWHVHVTEAKGFDIFSYDYYEEAIEYIQKAIELAGAEFIHIPSHMVEAHFPKTVEELRAYDVVIFSDVGANTLNLPMNVFLHLQPVPNKLEMIRDYVNMGGAFVMIGGYLSFQGIQGRGCYKNTPVEEILPVTLLSEDDRIERSGGICPVSVIPEHPVLENIPVGWPQLLGYNRFVEKEGAEVIVRLKEDPMIVLGTYGKGRTCAYASDCSPHWSPVEFCEWEGYQVLWKNLINWLSA